MIDFDFAHTRNFPPVTVSPKNPLADIKHFDYVHLTIDGTYVSNIQKAHDKDVPVYLVYNTPVVPETAGHAKVIMRSKHLRFTLPVRRLLNTTEWTCLGVIEIHLGN